MSKKLTPWFPGDVKPVRDGVYERRSNIDGMAYFSLYRGGDWWQMTSSFFTSVNSKFRSDRQSLPWRGLAKAPK